MKVFIEFISFILFNYVSIKKKYLQHMELTTHLSFGKDSSKKKEINSMETRNSKFRRMINLKRKKSFIFGIVFMKMAIKT